MAPVATTTLRPLGVADVALVGGFWGDRQALNRQATIPHARAFIEAEGWVDNFRIALSGDLPHGRRGREFTDADIHKWLEAVWWDHGRDGSTPAEGALDIVEVIAAAQEPDGYLNSEHGHQGLGRRWRNLVWGHELYCVGHLVQSGIAVERVGGPPAYAEVARRAADQVIADFLKGPQRGRVPGHPVIEAALVELYRQTHETRYLEQAQAFIDDRGRRQLRGGAFGPAYFSDDEPVRDSQAFRGHAVRALYLACGVVDVAVETGEAELLEPIVRQFDRTLARRTHLTGGMGSRHVDESFGEDFELPPDRAYAESCAGIGAVMLAWRLALATGRASYGDVIERVLYNIVAAGVGRDGRSFTYANALQQRRPAKGHVAADRADPGVAPGLRAPWFSVACCPPNLARMIASLGGYVATTDDTGLQVHQYASGTIQATLSGSRVRLRVDTDYPWDGAIRIAVDEAPGDSWDLRLRVPAWATGATTTIAGQGPRAEAPGWAVLTRAWQAGDQVRLDLPVHPRWSHPDPRIDAVRGCVAVERGPLVYCAEATGDDEALDAITVDTASPPTDRHDDPSLGDRASGGPGGGHAGVGATATLGAPDDEPWPYGSARGPTSTRVIPLELIPYHEWGNRGPASMRVWLPEEVTAP